MGKSKNEFEGEVDPLFKLPLSEFTGARNALATQLKKSGRGDQATLVKALAKPSVSAWAVNQLYWSHRVAFDKLLVSGEKFHKAQKSGKVADMRNALDARREVLTHLSDIAARVLRDGGHTPSPDTVHRITTTLEGISAYASRGDGPQLGRLTHDVDPPGFESFGSFVPIKQQARGVKQKAEGRKQNAGTAQRAKDESRKREEAEMAKVAAAKAALQETKKALGEAQARVRSLEAAKTRAQADVRQAEARLQEAMKRARSVEEDLKKAAKDLKDAERLVEKTSGEFESA